MERIGYFLKRQRKMCSWVGGKVDRISEEMREGKPLAEHTYEKKKEIFQGTL